LPAVAKHVHVESVIRSHKAGDNASTLKTGDLAFIDGCDRATSIIDVADDDAGVVRAASPASTGRQKGQGRQGKAQIELLCNSHLVVSVSQWEGARNAKA